MKLSTKGQYATRALLDLAQHPGDQPVQIRDIARRQQIPQRYLEHLITPLIAAGILMSTRGPRGGVSLVRSPDDISLDEVIHLLEGSVAPVECVNNPSLCNRATLCATRDIWGDLKEAINGVLSSVTLTNLVERQQAKNRAAEEMYNI